jgi:hypothetical protein
LFPIYFQHGGCPADTDRQFFHLWRGPQSHVPQPDGVYSLANYVKTVKRSKQSAANDPFLAARYQRLESCRGEVTCNYFYPFFHLRYGEGLKGGSSGRLWVEHKDIDQNQ